MLQWAATLAKLRADDWARLLGILAVAAVAIVVIWIVQRASASETEGDEIGRASCRERV